MQSNGKEEKAEHKAAPPRLTQPTAQSHSFSVDVASSSATSSTDTAASQSPLTCHSCSSPVLPTCVHGRCTDCCRQLDLYCPGHDTRPSLVGARFAAVLDGSVSGGLRLTAQLGDRIYRGVLFTQPAAVRIQRTRGSAAAGSSSTDATSTSSSSSSCGGAGNGSGSGSSAAQQQSQPSAKRLKTAANNTAALNGAERIVDNTPQR